MCSTTKQVREEEEGGSNTNRRCNMIMYSVCLLAVTALTDNCSLSNLPPVSQCNPHALHLRVERIPESLFFPAFPPPPPLFLEQIHTNML